jgi:hypothetical protein
MKKKAGELLRFNISVPLWLGLLVAALALIVLFLVIPNRREEITFIATVIGGGSAIYSAYYVGAALRLRLQRDRQQASFDILALLNRPEFVEVRGLVDDLVDGHEKCSAVDLYQKIQGDKKLDNSVTTVLGILEDASVAIQQEYADEAILALSIIDIVRRSHTGLHGYIDQLRKVRNVPTYFVELEKLAKAWGEKKKLSDGSCLGIPLALT